VHQVGDQTKVAYEFSVSRMFSIQFCLQFTWQKFDFICYETIHQHVQ